LEEIGALENALEKLLERELLSKPLTPAKPVGLRYDRLEGEGLVYREREMPPEQSSDFTPRFDEDIASEFPADFAPGSSTDASRVSSGGSYWYFLCNGLLISRLLARCKNVLVTCGEGWSRDLFCWEAKEVVRICLSSSVSPVHKRGVVSVEAYERFSYRDGSFDGVVVDSSILLSNSVRTSLREFRRVLKPAGRLCAVAVNWEYEMAGKTETYETSFRRYGSKVYLGLLKRTLSPPMEVEYVCLLDPKEGFVKKLASMEREELRTLSLADVPGAAKAVVSAELIEIPQFTRAFLEDVCAEAGFSGLVVSGAPGILAFRLFKGLVLPCWTRTAGSAAKPATAPTTAAAGSATKSTAALTLFGDSHRVMNDIPQRLVCAFPFISSVDNPHIVAVCAR
jgi:SAM-dependent methyltransferase